jgi:two-component system NtrC family sensor kinase
MPSDTQHEHAAVKRIILACMILVPLVPLVLILGIGYYYFATTVETDTTASMRRIVTDHGQMIERFLQERQADLEFVVDTHGFSALQRPEGLRAIFAALQRQSPAFADLGIFDADGLHVAYQGAYPLQGKVYKDTEWFQQVMAQGTYVSNVFLGFRNVPHFIIAIAREVDGRPWVIRATIDSLLFSDMVRRFRFGRTGEAFIIDAAGILQTDRRSGGRLMEASPDKDLIPAAGQEATAFIAREAGGGKYLYTALGLKQGQWRLVVRREVADAFAGLRTAVYLIVLTMTLGGSVIVALAVTLTRMILRRMDRADSEKRRLNEQLIRAARLAEIGQMASGVAHEINNPLQIIKSEQLLIEMNLADLKSAGQLPPSATLAEIEESFQQIKAQIDRCGKITQAVLKFGRQSEVRIEPVALQALVPEIVAMVAKKAAVHGIRVEQALPEDLSPVDGDPGQLQQVFLNLFNNAIDAILERHGATGGRLAVRASHGDHGRVVVRVEDNGSGISPDNLEKVFAPFFTTKPVGKGTGLGLAVCYGIVEQMGGRMSVTSETGVGTAFSVDLPASPPPTAP